MMMGTSMEVSWEENHVWRDYHTFHSGWVEFNHHLKCLTGDVEQTVVLQIRTQGQVKTGDLNL